MMLEVTDLMLLTVVIAIGVYWWRAPSVYALALRSARQHCRKLELAFLDDSVALSRLWVKRDDEGRLRLWRVYQFEFTATGGERYRGQVRTLGYTVEAIDMPPYRVEPEPPPTLH